MEKKVLNYLLIGIFSVGHWAMGQCPPPAPLLMQNPSFEGPQIAHETPGPWKTCQIGQTPDTQPGSWGVTQAPSDGTSYLGLVAQYANNDPNSGNLIWQEGASQPLSGPMVAGTEYSFTADLSNTSATGGGIEPGCAELQIWGGFSRCDRGQLLYSSGDITNIDQWKTFNITIVPGQNFTWFSFMINPLGCSALPYILLDNVTPVIPKPVNVSLSQLLPVLCPGQSTGSIRAHVKGQNPPFNYQWSVPPSKLQNDSTAINLTTGTYGLTVTNALGCLGTASITVTEPTPLVRDTIAIADANCFGMGGSALLRYRGGTPYTITPGQLEYNYNWSDGSTELGTAPGSNAGTYRLTVTDANGCTAVDSAIIPPGPGFYLDTTVRRNNCLSASSNIDATVTPVLGSSGVTYTYIWNTSPVQTTPTATNLNTGTYKAVVTASDGCKDSAVFNITAPPKGIFVTPTGTNVKCYGQSTGQITLAVNAVNPISTYTWSPAVSTSDVASNLPVGTYRVTVTDDKNCQDTASLVITQSDSIAITLTSSDVTCFGNSSGFVRAKVTGGNRPYSYVWNTSPTQTDSLAKSLPAGTYTVTVTDSTSCINTRSRTINQPAAPLSSATVQTNILCYGDSVGSVGVILSGGTLPYVYEWRDSVYLGDSSGLIHLKAGIYYVRSSDAGGCVIYDSILVDQPAAPFSVLKDSLNLSCYLSADGEATVAVSGNTAPYTYVWNTNPVQTSASATGLAAGKWIVNITDNNNCRTKDSFQLVQPAELIRIVSTGNVSCSGGADGNITITASGGNPGYTYTWNPAVSTTNFAGSLPAGVYSVTVADQNNCTKDTTITITEPSALTLDSAGINIKCFGAADGKAIVIPGGATPFVYGYDILWTPGNSTNDTISNLASGIYSVQVTDSLGCRANATVTITEPAALQISGVITDVLCFGGTNGAIDVTVSGGILPYTFVWSNSAATEDISGVVSGTYILTVTDAGGCTITYSGTVSQPVVLTSSRTGTNVTCFGAANGAVDITVSGGVTPYTFLWGHGPVTEDISGLSGGFYSVVITDQNGCTKTDTITIQEPPLLSVSTVVTDVLCNGTSTGAIDVTVAGGTPAYTYKWSNAAVTEDLSAQPAGSYQVTITDANGCSINTAATIAEPAAISISHTTVDVVCFNQPTGRIVLTLGGGATPFSFVWTNNVSTVDSAINLIAGVYNVTATDANGCTVTDNATINQPTDLLVVPAITNVSCFGGNNGAINLTVSGATPAYTYIWQPAVSTSDIASTLAAGNYAVTITDANNCTKNFQYVVTEPPLLSVSTTKTDVLCFGGNSGRILSATTGGVAPYSFTWQPIVSTNDSAINLFAGGYSVTVTDANSCTDTITTIINEPLAPLDASSVADSVNCFGASDGSISITAVDGTPGYTYTWSPPVSTTAIATQLAAGSYDVTVTDANGCTFAITTLVEGPTQLTASNIKADVLCHDSATGTITITAAGGTPGYLYVWQPNVSSSGVAIGLTAGTYNATVTDAKNCTVATSAVITQPSAIQVQQGSDPATCFGLSDGAITLSATGGTAGYNYNITQGGTPVSNNATGSFINLPAGNYEILVIDNNNCPYNSTISITQPDQLVLTANADSAKCFGYTDGSILAQASFGSPAYTFTLSTGAENSTGYFGDLSAGSYSVTVKDANNCTADVSLNVEQPDSVSIILDPSDDIYINLGDKANINATSNYDPAAFYNWRPAAGLNCDTCRSIVVNVVNNTPYVLTVTAYPNGRPCTADRDIMVNVIPNYDLYIPNLFSPNGDGRNDLFSINGNLGAIKKFEMQIFDRWGELVYQSYDQKFAWDGFVNGTDAPSDVYVYIMKVTFINNFTQKMYKGSVTLLR
jgi:gliding motility-associated-like protein